MLQRKLLKSNCHRIWLAMLCGVMFLNLVTTENAHAQSAPSKEAASAAAAVQPAVAGRAEQYPPSPSFFRGNRPTNLDFGGAGDSGFYLNLWRFIPIVGVFFGWVWIGKWVNQDSLSLKVNSEYWNSAVLLGGLGGLFVILTMSHFGLGFFLMLALQGGPLGLYIRERNSCVPESARLLTKKHITSVTLRLLRCVF